MRTVTIGEHQWRLMNADVNRARDSRFMVVVNAVAHTGITVRDLNASISFWREVFGFEVQHRLELAGEFAEQVTGVRDAHFELAVLVGGGHHIELLQYFRPAGRRHLCPRPCDVGAFHVAVDVDDLDAAAEACAARGWRLVGTPQTGIEGPLAGSRFAYLRNGDGSTVELIQTPENGRAVS